MRKSYDKKENGRSMIEMLGVLAIIGVLSVGGIAGYSKAMHRYRMNKTIEEIALVAGNVRTMFSTQGKYTGLDSTSSDGRNLMQKAKLIPEEMWNAGKTAMENPFGGNFKLKSAAKAETHDEKAFYIYLTGIPQEACLELGSYNWQDIENVLEVTVGPGMEVDMTYDMGAYIPNIRCKGAGTDLYTACHANLPIKLENILSYCTNANDNKMAIVFQ